MNQKNLPKVIFFQIKKPLDKLLKITKTAYLHFENKKHLLFLASDDKVEKYIDDLLWKEPKFSFLPHVISDTYTSELVAITKKNININNALYIFNLSSDPFFHFSCRVIYEFDDYSDKKRALISKKKFQVYREKGYLIESR